MPITKRAIKNISPTICQRNNKNIRKNGNKSKIKANIPAGIKVIRFRLINLINSSSSFKFLVKYVIGKEVTSVVRLRLSAISLLQINKEVKKQYGPCLLRNSSFQYLFESVKRIDCRPTLFTKSGGRFLGKLGMTNERQGHTIILVYQSNNLLVYYSINLLVY